MTQLLRGERRSLALLVPALAFLAICYVGPLFYTLALSVLEPTVGFANFVRMLQPVYLKIFANTFEIALTVSTLCLVIAYPTSLFIASRPPRIASILLALVAIPFFTSLLVRNYAWIFLLGTTGVINTLLTSLGVVDHPLPLMFNRFGVVVGMTHVLLPYLVLILVNTLRGIDERVVRAGISLGCGPFANFRRVILPLSVAGAGGGFVLIFVIALAFFVTPAMLGSPQDSMVANAIASEVGFLNWGFSAALGMVLLAIALVCVVFMQKAFGGIGLLAPGLAQVRMRVRSRGRFSRSLDDALRAMDVLLDRIWDSLLATVAMFSIAFLILPVLIVVPLSFSSAEYFVFPPPGWSLRWYQTFFDNPQWMDALGNSVIIGFLTVAITMTLAVPAALGITFSRSRKILAAYLLIISPLIVPTIITAISVFFAFSKVGFGRSILGIAIGHSIGAMPLAVVVLVAAFSNFDWSLDRAGQSLGSPPIRTFFKVVLPILSGTIAVAAFLTFLHSFDDLLIALFLGGLQLETLPRRMWESLQEINPTIAAVSTLLIALILVLLSVVHILQRRQSRRLSARA